MLYNFCLIVIVWMISRMYSHILAHNNFKAIVIRTQMEFSLFRIKFVPLVSWLIIIFHPSMHIVHVSGTECEKRSMYILRIISKPQISVLANLKVTFIKVRTLTGVWISWYSTIWNSRLPTSSVRVWINKHLMLTFLEGLRFILIIEFLLQVDLVLAGFLLLLMF